MLALQCAAVAANRLPVGSLTTDFAFPSRLDGKSNRLVPKPHWLSKHRTTFYGYTVPSMSSNCRGMDAMQVRNCGGSFHLLRDREAAGQRMVLNTCAKFLERSTRKVKQRSSCRGNAAHRMNRSALGGTAFNKQLRRSSHFGPKARDISSHGRLTGVCESRIGSSWLGHCSRAHERPLCSWWILKKGSMPSSAPFRAVWISRTPRHGRKVVSALPHGEGGEGAQHIPQDHRGKFEIHGRRTRAARPAHHGPYNNVLFQAFTWESFKRTDDGKSWWQVLKSHVKELAALGITDVWLPPVSQSVDRQGYLPSELYNLDASKYGTGVQLKELIDELHINGISVIADIVINHRSGGSQDNTGHWNVFKGGNKDMRLDWGAWAVVDDDIYDAGGKGHHDTGASYAAAPDLDHTNKQVQDELSDWMNWLKAEIGFDGWRFDFVKGYAPSYTKLYCMRTNPTLAVGELWTSMDYEEGQLAWDQNQHRQELCNWIDGTEGTCSAFDFTTKGILQCAAENEYWRLKDSNGKAAGLIGWWPERAVTFLDNHDTGSTQRHWPFPDKRILLGYAYILTHPGTPCIFYDHIYQNKLMAEIKKLLDLRKRHRINAVSKIIIQKAEDDIYICKIDNRVILKMGPRYDMGGLLPEKDLWKMTITGPDYAIWETTAPLPPLPKPPRLFEEMEQATPAHPPTQPIHITNKMSARTRSRIMKEVPELVDQEEIHKGSPESKTIGSEQDHVHKEFDSRTSKKYSEDGCGYRDRGTAGTPAEVTFGIDGCREPQPTTFENITTRFAASPELNIHEKIVSKESLKDPNNNIAPVQLDADPHMRAKPKVRSKTGKGSKDKVVKIEGQGNNLRSSRPTIHGPHDNILLQGFNWESPHIKTIHGISWWEFLKTKVKDFVKLGVTDVWLPPPSDSVDKNGYLPSELYNLNASHYGTAAELKELIDELHLNGICAIADIVINHRCGRIQDDAGRWNYFRGGTPDQRLDWGPWAVVDDDIYDCGGEGTHDTGEKFDGAPDLDHTNKRVQDELTDWMNWLKTDIGFDGWRFDFVKGYDPKFTAMYCARTNPSISVGEFWTDMSYYYGRLEADQNGHRQRLCNWIDGTNGTSCVFDFTTKGILQQAVQDELWRLEDSNGKPTGLIGWYPQKAVTFIDNHDTGSTQRHWCFPDDKVEMGYAYIITHPGIPCIFLDHLYDFNLMDKIHALLEIRKRNGINAMSNVVIQIAESNIYVAKIDDQVILKLGSRVDMDELLPDTDMWKIVASGDEYCIWEIVPPSSPLPLPFVQEATPQGHNIQPTQPTRPIRLTKKMSKGTKKRISKADPELLKPDDSGENRSQRPKSKS